MKRPTILSANKSRLGSALSRGSKNSRAGSRAGSAHSHRSRINVNVDSIESSSDSSDEGLLNKRDLQGLDVPFISAPTTSRGLNAFNGLKGGKQKGAIPRISVGKLDIGRQTSQDSRSLVSPMSPTSGAGENEKNLDKEDYYNIGKEIIANVGKGPKMCRMGDIYHMIK